MRVSFGISLAPGTPLLRQEETRAFMDLAKMADDYGAAAIGTYDSAFLGGDAYVRATLLSLASSRARVGLRPTNPLTREPQVMASFLASIDSLTGGRAFVDIASGDSAVLNIGYGVASRARIEDYVGCLRDLLATGEATYQGRPQRVRWASTAVRPRIPISICAEGPRMLHLGGRIGDGVVAGTGLLPEVIRDTIARIHAGAREAGRDPSEVDIWFTTRSSLHQDRETAIESVKASVSSILNHSMRFGLDGKHVPDDLRAKIQSYVDGYVLYDHVLHAGQNPKRMEDLGLTDYAIRRFALAGGPGDWIARIEELAEAGATKLWVSLRAGDLDSQRRYMRILGEEIMARFVA
ncbi:MAG TPA: LLM class flavin-dependent oxidoreductase [Methylomirabilota bacterium]|jgi:5,10-methylenetetrahydromethanopterin reductase|nr:LLM class flavin-dependent oxidoreductase [Methylomirabilota bacterium]